jgi:hypothetical protein
MRPRREAACCKSRRCRGETALNRELVEWIQPAGYPTLAFPEVPIKADPRAKEFAWDPIL